MNVKIPHPLLAGEKYSLTCTVTSDLPHSVKWLDPNLNEVDASNTSKATYQTVLDETTSTLILNFDPLKTSHGGNYSCLSIISQLHVSKIENVTMIVQGKFLVLEDKATVYLIALYLVVVDSIFPSHFGVWVVASQLFR